MVACGSDSAEVEDTSGTETDYGSAKLAWTSFGQNDMTDDVPVVINWGGGFVVMRYWMSISIPEPGTGFAVTASCVDENGVTQFGDGGIGDGASSAALQGEFIFYKEVNTDCDFLFDSIYVGTSPTFDYHLEVGTPN